MRLSTSITALCLTLALGLFGCGSGEDSGGDGDGSASGGKFATPEACFEASKKALESKDWAGLYDCMTPEGKTKTIAILSIMAGFSTMGDEAAAEEQKALLAKHKVKESEGTIDLGDEAAMMKAIEESVADVPDKRAFVADLGAFVNKHATSMDSKKLSEIKNVKTDGDKATATIVTMQKDGSKKEDAVTFRKVDGSWLMDFPE